MDAYGISFSPSFALYVQLTQEDGPRHACDCVAHLVWGCSEQIDAIAFPKALGAIPFKHSKCYLKHSFLAFVQHNLKLDSFQGGHGSSGYHC